MTGTPSPGPVRVLPYRPGLAAAVVDELVDRVAIAVEDRGAAHVVLTGGSMGTAVMEELAVRVRDGGLPADVWGRVHLWWGDERFLPAGDDDRNDTQADEAGLGDLPVPPEHVHRVPSPEPTLDVHRAAVRYAEELADTALDVVMLGVGPDTHVASLFPGHPALEATEAVVGVTDSPKPPPERVTFTLPTINAARAVWLVVSGEDKAEAVARAHAAPDGDPQVPASLVHGTAETLWWLDGPAATTTTTTTTTTTPLP